MADIIIQFTKKICSESYLLKYQMSGLLLVTFLSQLQLHQVGLQSLLYLKFRQSLHKTLDVVEQRRIVCCYLVLAYKYPFKFLSFVFICFKVFAGPALSTFCLIFNQALCCLDVSSSRKFAFQLSTSVIVCS